MSKFYDIDLPFGEKYEDTLSEILTDKMGSKVEVKTERDIWYKTGNIYVELVCREAFSGLVTTKADWWATILTLDEDVKRIVILPTNLMKKRVKQLIKNKIASYPVSGGDDDASIGALIPIKELISYEE
tara:strand:- start:143 stop:529 length:387 start_codon:yes stop_codon:yes gene_type:complete